MPDAFICDAVRTPIGRYGGMMAALRTDDLAAVPLTALMSRNPDCDWAQIDDVVFGCANQAGEDNRNIGRMAVLLAGLPVGVPAVTVNRLCGSGMDAVGIAARGIRSGDCDLVIAGGVESMSRAPFVVAKAEMAYSRDTRIYDTTIGWRFVNPKMVSAYGSDSMAATADNVAAAFGISRGDQDAFALRSQERWSEAERSGRFADELIAVTVPQRRGDPIIVTADEHPRPQVTGEKLAAMSGINGANLSVTPGNATGLNDGAAAMLIAGAEAAKIHGLEPKARIVAMAVAGVEPRIMGIGPAPAARKALERAGLRLEQMDLIELNEAFAAQALAVLRDLGVPDDAAHVNPNGGAIALGHPLGMSGARLVTTATWQLCRNRDHYALCMMCIGVGQGIAVILERV